MKHLTLVRLSLIAVTAVTLGACASKPEVMSTTTTHQTTTTDTAAQPTTQTTTTTTR